jgi:hypothetical protein
MGRLAMPLPIVAGTPLLFCKLFGVFRTRCRSTCELLTWKMVETQRNTILLDPAVIVKTLNPMMIGWANYFCLGSVSKAYRAIEQHARERLRQWLCAKHKLRGAASKRYPDTTLHGALGLARLCVRTASFPWAKA